MNTNLTFVPTLFLKQVAKYILHSDDLTASSSESDDTDDSDYEDGHPRFWTF
jgi:hypothetical protein